MNKNENHINQSNVDIFINAYKDFDVCPTNPIYKIISAHDIAPKNGLLVYKEVDDEYLPLQDVICEFTMMNWVYKNLPLKDYVGFCQYRRYLDFWDKVPDMDEIFKEYDIIVGNPTIHRKSIANAYSVCHNLDDLDDLDFSVSSVFGEHSQTSQAWRLYKSAHIIYTNNIFIMKKADFVKYMEWMNPIVKDFIAKRHWENYQDVFDYVMKRQPAYLKQFPPNNTIEYQSRILAYLIERLTSFYICAFFEKPKTYPIIKTALKECDNDHHAY